MMRRAHPVFCVLTAGLGLGLGLTGCASFPALDHTVSAETERADYPAFLTTDELQAIAVRQSSEPDPTDDLEARATGLRARAAALLLTSP